MKEILDFKFSHEAEEDLVNLYNFLVLQGEEQAFDVIFSRFEKALNLIRTFPKMAPWDTDLEARHFLVPKTQFKIIFEENKNFLNILRIFHVAQKWED